MWSNHINHEEEYQIKELWSLKLIKWQIGANRNSVFFFKDSIKVKYISECVWILDIWAMSKSFEVT